MPFAPTATDALRGERTVGRGEEVGGEGDRDGDSGVTLEEDDETCEFVFPDAPTTSEAERFDGVEGWRGVLGGSVGELVEVEAEAEEGWDGFKCGDDFGVESSSRNAGAVLMIGVISSISRSAIFGVSTSIIERV